MEFDSLASEAKQSQAKARAAMDLLWKHVYSLQEWCFIDRGKQGAPVPFIGTIEGKQYVMGFTDAARATAFARTHIIQDAAAHVPILAIPVKGAVDYFSAFATHGIFGIMFNHDTEGFFVPLQNLKPMSDHFITNNKQDS
jgi:hypothetical protein